MWQRRGREPGQPACWLYRPTEGAESGGAPKVSQVLRALHPDPPRKSGWFNKQNRRPVCDVRVLPEDMKPSGEVRWFLHVTSAVARRFFSLSLNYKKRPTVAFSCFVNFLGKWSVVYLCVTVWTLWAAGFLRGVSVLHHFLSRAKREMIFMRWRLPLLRSQNSLSEVVAPSRNILLRGDTIISPVLSIMTCQKSKHCATQSLSVRLHSGQTAVGCESVNKHGELQPGDDMFD